MTTDEVLAAIDAFNDAFNRHDVDAVMAAMTDDCAFEDTSPPDGGRHEGQAAVRQAFAGFFASAPGAWFDAEELIATGDRCVVRWRYTFDNREPDSGHLRGIDVFRIRGDKVAEKVAYVKG